MTKAEKHLIWYRTEEGTISILYRDMILRARKRKHKKPKFSKQTFIKWLYNNNFKQQIYLLVVEANVKLLQVINGDININKS